MTPLQTANTIVTDHLLDIIRHHIAAGVVVENIDLSKLKDMCFYILDHVEMMTDDKTSRWIGYIQGCLSTVGVLNVEEERDFTRIIFHKAYEEMGMEKPITVSL